MEQELHRDWVIGVVRLVVHLMVFLAVWVAVEDPYHVFRADASAGAYANDRYNKTAWVLGHGLRLDGLILGSSVMGVFDPDEVSRALGGGRWYNLSFLAGRPGEYLELLPRLWERGVRPGQVLYGLDLFPFIDPPPGDTPATRPHPVVSGEPELLWKARYLLLLDMPLLLESMSNIRGEPRPVAWDFSRGRFDILRRRVGRQGSVKPVLPVGTRLDEEVWKQIRRLRQYLARRGIQARWVINPVSREIRRVAGECCLEALKEKARRLLPGVVDLSGLDAGGEHYLDAKHFDRALAREYLRVLDRRMTGN